MLTIGSDVLDPRPNAAAGRVGTVVEVVTNPACLMRTLVVRWQDGETEEVEEIVFGPLDD